MDVSQGEKEEAGRDDHVPWRAPDVQSSHLA